jgi:lipopolysaccharide/colanic/teichoic acid biosynthesis glycosyltransferase
MNSPMEPVTTATVSASVPSTAPAHPAETDRARAGHAHAVHPGASGLAGTRRVLNVLVALVLLVVSAPVWLVIAALIKLTSRGPVLYVQTRVGLDQRRSGIRPNDPRRRSDIGGRPFTIYKFRTMEHDAESVTGAVWASHDDPRITPVGRVLRQYRLDELPQIINVLRGDMNLVGPRPERPSIVSELRKEIPHYQQRHRTLPGITGHAQVNLQYDSSLEDVRKKVDHDLEYLQRASAWEDFKIMIKTVPVMLFRRGSR